MMVSQPRWRGLGLSLEQESCNEKLRYFLLRDCCNFVEVDFGERGSEVSDCKKWNKFLLTVVQHVDKFRQLVKESIIKTEQAFTNWAAGSSTKSISTQRWTRYKVVVVLRKPQAKVGEFVTLEIVSLPSVTPDV